MLILVLHLKRDVSCFFLLLLPVTITPKPIKWHKTTENLVSGVQFKLILLTSPKYGKANPPFPITLVHPVFWVPNSSKGHRKQAGKKLRSYVSAVCMVLRIRMRRESYHVTWAWGQHWCQILSCSAKAKLGCCSGCLSLFTDLLLVWWSFGGLSECMCCLWWCWLRIHMVDYSLQLAFWFLIRGVSVSPRLIWVRHASFLCHFIMVMLVTTYEQFTKKKGKNREDWQPVYKQSEHCLTSVLFNF